MLMTIDRPKVISALANIRQEWEESLDGESLIEARGSVGLILGDVVMALSLTSEEQRAVLGESLRKDFVRVLRTR